MLKRLVLFLLLATLPLLNGCFGSMLSKESHPDIKEQYYVNARLNFAIQHPLAWQEQQILVSSPEYRPDRVSWLIQDPSKKNHSIGEMTVRSTPADAQKKLPELLNSFLLDLPPLESRKTKAFDHPAGKALQLQGKNNKHGWLITAIKGQFQDFIISFDFPASRLAELLPIFQDTLESFTEIAPSTAKAK